MVLMITPVRKVQLCSVILIVDRTFSVLVGYWFCKFEKTFFNTTITKENDSF